jgi:acyl carrier protein
MTTKEDLVKRVLFKIVSESTGIPTNKIAFESKFVQDLGYDSIDTLETVMALEVGLKIEIDDNQIEKLKTVKDAYDYLLTCPTNPQEEIPSVKQFFTGTLIDDYFDGSGCAEIDCGNDITVSINRYDNHMSDTVFPEILENFKDKKVLITIELAK